MRLGALDWLQVMWIPLLSADRASIDQIEDSPSTASTVVKILAHMYGPAAGWGIVPQGGNPCRSVAEHRSVVNRHIVPALGRLPLAAVKRRYVMELHESLCTTPEIANIAVDVLTHMFALAKGWGIVAVDCNACQFIPMNPKHMREQFLTDAEFTRRGRVLDEVSGKGSRMSAGAVATIRLLMHTGCQRKNRFSPCAGGMPFNPLRSSIDPRHKHTTYGKRGMRS